jgi:shikimate dehydrogenase
MSPVVTGLTGHVGVIGDPVRHSLSPTLHNAAYTAMGLDLVYGAFVVHDGDAEVALRGACALGFLGLSVTTPHKDAIAKAADERTRRAELLGAANSVVFRGGTSLADSTDGEGLLADLSTACGFVPEGANCAVIGAGGAARAVVLALASAGAERVTVVNRSPDRARAASDLAGSKGHVGEVAELAKCDLVINATSLGLTADESASDVARALAANLHEGQLVVDLVYRPAHTVFLLRAAERGASVRNGLGMLVHQAALQVELFTGRTAPVDVMWAAVASELTN